MLYMLAKQRCFCFFVEWTYSEINFVDGFVPCRLDDVPLKGLKFLSQSTDSLHQGSKVNASTESLIDEGSSIYIHLTTHTQKN